MTFAAPRNLGDRPNPDRARPLFAERLQGLAARGDDMLVGEVAEKVQRRLAAALTGLSSAREV